MVRRRGPNRRSGDQAATCRWRRRQPWVPGPRAQGPGFFPNPPRNHPIRAGSTSPGGWGAAAEAPPRPQPQRPYRITLPLSLGSKQERRGTWTRGLGNPGTCCPTQSRGHTGFSHLPLEPGAEGAKVVRARKRGERVGPAPSVPPPRPPNPHCPCPQPPTTRISQSSTARRLPHRPPSAPGPRAPSPHCPCLQPPTTLRPQPPVLDRPAPPGPTAARYSPAAPVAAAGGAGARLGVAVLLQGCGREGVEEAGGQRRPAEAAARPGQEESQLHLARPPAGARSPGREDSRERTGGRTEPAAPPGAEQASRRASRARVRAESVWGAPTPLQGCLFKFSERRKLRLKRVTPEKYACTPCPGRFGPNHCTPGLPQNPLPLSPPAPTSPAVSKMKRLNPRSYMRPWPACTQAGLFCAAGSPQHCTPPKGQV